MTTVPVPSSSAARVDGLRRLAATLRRSDLVWLAPNRSASPSVPGKMARPALNFCCDLH